MEEAKELVKLSSLKEWLEQCEWMLTKLEDHLDSEEYHEKARRICEVYHEMCLNPWFLLEKKKVKRRRPC